MVPVKVAAVVFLLAAVSVRQGIKVNLAFAIFITRNTCRTAAGTVQC